MGMLAAFVAVGERDGVSDYDNSCVTGVSVYIFTLSLSHSLSTFILYSI